MVLSGIHVDRDDAPGAPGEQRERGASARRDDQVRAGWARVEERDLEERVFPNLREVQPIFARVGQPRASKRQAARCHSYSSQSCW